MIKLCFSGMPAPTTVRHGMGGISPTLSRAPFRVRNLIDCLMRQADTSISGMIMACAGVEGINAGAQLRSDSLTHRQLQRSAACCARLKWPRSE